MGVFKQMIKSHNKYCGCNYCIKLVNYVELKKYKSRNIRNYYSDSYYDFKLGTESLALIRKLEIAIKEAKIEKDLLKII